MAYLSCVTTKEKGRVLSGTVGGLLCVCLPLDFPMKLFGTKRGPGVSLLPSAAP